MRQATKKKKKKKKKRSKSPIVGLKKWNKKMK